MAGQQQVSVERKGPDVFMSVDEIRALEHVVRQTIPCQSSGAALWCCPQLRHGWMAVLYREAAHLRQ